MPKSREALERLPGVGRKTANVVLNVAFGEHTIAVDTHIFRVGNRTGLAPGKTPKEVLAKINTEVNRALASPDMKDRLAKLGGEPMKMSPAEFDAFMRKEHDVLGQLMRDAGATPQ